MGFAALYPSYNLAVGPTHQAFRSGQQALAMGARDCERPDLRFIDLALEIRERLRLPMHTFGPERQGFGLRSNSDKKQDIGIAFEARLRAVPCNCPGAFDRRHASGKYRFRRLDDDLASSNDLGLIPAHDDPDLNN